MLRPERLRAVITKLPAGAAEREDCFASTGAVGSERLNGLLAAELFIESCTHTATHTTK